MSVIRGACPTCGKAFEIPSIDALPSFPFCTERCRLIDLGRWLGDDYAITGHQTNLSNANPDPGDNPSDSGFDADPDDDDAD